MPTAVYFAISLSKQNRNRAWAWHSHLLDKASHKRTFLLRQGPTVALLVNSKDYYRRGHALSLTETAQEPKLTWIAAIAVVDPSSSRPTNIGSRDYHTLIDTGFVAVMDHTRPRFQVFLMLSASNSGLALRRRSTTKQTCF